MRIDIVIRTFRYYLILNLDRYCHSRFLWKVQIWSRKFQR